MKIESFNIDEVIDNDLLKTGDMPGDKVLIGDDHLNKAKTIFPLLVEEINKLNKDKIVISVFGGSGVGKSEIASLIGYHLEKNGIHNYVLSGDNYPFRIPLYNDAERLSTFRSNGIKGLVEQKLFNEDIKKQLSDLWIKEIDSDPNLINEHPWLKVYQENGRSALKEYLGTRKEQDYDDLNRIIKEFKNSETKIFLKRMGKTEEDRWYDEIDFSNINVLIIEWTHGGNGNIEGIDIPIYLNSTVEETRLHRRLRARDGKTDSAFTTMVLEIEQEELFERAKYSKIIISKSGEIMKAEDVVK